MKLSINLVHHGRYVRAGDELPSDFQLPSHLEQFAVHDDQPQGSRAASIQAEGVRRGGSKLANSAVDDNKRDEYPAGEEEFTPKWRLKRKKRRDEL